MKSYSWTLLLEQCPWTKSEYSEAIAGGEDDMDANHTLG
jgi:hypothetical protein